MDALSLFIDTLPSDKKLPALWLERYIDDVEAMPNYNYIKQLAIKKNRYLNLSEDKYGFSLEPFDTCNTPNLNKSNLDNKNSPNLNNSNNSNNSNTEKCNDCCEYDSKKEKCVYDNEKCINFFAQNVKNWSDLCRYHILFLQGKVPGTPEHIGPWNSETSLIIRPLIEILSNEILTRDSQPGALIFTDSNNSDNDGYEQTEYLQKPYLAIAGEASRIHRILIKILFSSDIKYVPDSLKRLEFYGYNNFETDNNDYVSVMLGIYTPDYLSLGYIEYLFSNSFFDFIADVVKNTP